MPIADLAITLNQVLPTQPSMGWFQAGAWQDHARIARHVFRSIARRQPAAPVATTSDFGDDFPMIAALCETHQARCRQQQALAELRGDDPMEA